MDILILSCSLSPDSRSRMMAKYAENILAKEKHNITFLDLRDFELPICDGDSSYQHPNVKILSDHINKIQGILVATPIYNFDVNAALKNLIELTGRYWVDKVVGFMCSAGGSKSYMSVMSLANSLMLDFRSIIIPRFAFVGGGYETEQDLSESVKHRIADLCKEMSRFVIGLKS